MLILALTDPSPSTKRRAMCYSVFRRPSRCSSRMLIWSRNGSPRFEAGEPFKPIYLQPLDVLGRLSHGHTPMAQELLKIATLFRVTATALRGLASDRLKHDGSTV